MIRPPSCTVQQTKCYTKKKLRQISCNISTKGGQGYTVEEYKFTYMSFFFLVDFFFLQCNRFQKEFMLTLFFSRVANKNAKKKQKKNKINPAHLNLQFYYIILILSKVQYRFNSRTSVVKTKKSSSNAVKSMNVLQIKVLLLP